MIHKHCDYFFLCLMLLTTLTARAADVVWFDGQHPVTYQLAGKVSPVVHQALAMFCNDMQQVTGLRPIASKQATIYIRQGKADDDGFCLSVNDKGQIVVAGHNARGTAYGLLQLSRLAGVSPWIWWGDVTPERRKQLCLPDTFRMEHTPSVAYRGIFINDEDWSLRPWAEKTYEQGGRGVIGPKTYKALFQLLLRLRGNAIWPAMHEGTAGFFTVKGNKEMADSFGILVGSSHCEPLLRNNVAEWDRQQRGAYNYITNRRQVQQYWTERLREMKGSEALLTIGMRGIHDGSMEGVKTKEEKLSGLQQVIDDQRQMIRRYYDKDVERVPQVFIPYKEVLEILESGLRVPDDVMLMWCDDNYGYMTRLPDARQQQRQGGGGVYYHLSYWGRPHDHLWLTTMQPGLIYQEMKTAYDHNCRRLWIANVHDPKVAAYDLELFLDMAWDINCLQPQTIRHHLEQWLCTQFGEAAGRKLTPVMHEFYRLCGIRKPEFMGWTQVELDKRKYPGGKSPVSQTEMTLSEACQRIADFGSIEASADAYARLVPERLQQAYYAHVLYPIHAAAAMSRKMLSDSVESRKAYDDILSMTKHYNQLAGGKWAGLMDAAPRRLPVFGKTHAQLQPNSLDSRYIARNAVSYHQATPGCLPIQMLGHSMQAVSIPKDGTLLFQFTTKQQGNAILYTAMIPTHPNDKGDLRYQIQIDDQPAIILSLKQPYRSEVWKQNVLRGQALSRTAVRLTKGSHTLRIKALDAHIIMDQWMVDFQTDRQFYVIPAETEHSQGETVS